MHAILLAIGTFVAIIGAVLVRYGVPLDEYGNSPLLVSGMVALVGGLILIALSFVVRTLKRIAERLDVQTLLPKPADLVQPAAATPVPRSVAPPPAVKVDSIPDVAAPPPEPWIEPRVEPTIAPPPPRAPAALPPRAAVAPPAPAPAPAKPSLLGGLFGAKSKKPLVVSRKTAPPGDARVDLGALAQVPDAVPRSPAPAGNGAALPRPVEPATNSSVYKSGVIDGMAYTLYIDGSIEAELPQGTIRFATVEALQTYLAGR